MVPADLNRSVVKKGNQSSEKQSSRTVGERTRGTTTSPDEKKKNGSKQKRVVINKPTHEMEKPKPGFEKPTPIVRSGQPKEQKETTNGGGKEQVQRR
jgi:hypothetical protein